ncbi:MAG: LysR family transcriptional regulator [Burkholderiales bacterium]|nr:LysR family transcriptional regulator [Burkholderiales bacterium]
MELYQLRSFVTVAQLRHLTRAAEKLHLSQPALSGHIKALEDEFQLTLFERSSSGMQLTPSGLRLLAAAERTLAAAQSLRNDARAIRGTVTGVVSVGTLSDPEFLRLGRFAAATMERHPLLQMQFHREVSGAAFERVRDGDLDASFYYGDRSDPTIAGVHLTEIAYRVVAPIDWAPRIGPAGWAEIEREPWILTPSISTHWELANGLFRTYGVSPAKVVEADDENVIASLVTSGTGMALMREDIALEKANAGTICLWNDVRVTTTLQFIHQEDRAEDPALHALVDVLRDVWHLPA